MTEEIKATASKLGKAELRRLNAGDAELAPTPILMAPCNPKTLDSPNIRSRP
jgi:hypothetical protein